MKHLNMGPLIIDIAGTELTGEDKELLLHPAVGGLIFFTRNYESPEQLKALTQSIRALRKPFLITVDQEGGRVQRFKAGFTRLPPMAVFGELYAKDKTKACNLARKTGWLLAIELLAQGVDLSFTPVVDLKREISEVIGDRAFHQQPEIVSMLAAELIGGMNSAGMSACLKHFPGHGSVAADSHVALPLDPRDIDEIKAQDLLAFKPLLGLERMSIMMAHIQYPNIDNQVAGFSKFWIQKVLRKELNFKGVIFSDDLSMAGAHIIKDEVDRASAALQAGCDMILWCNDRKASIKVIDGLSTFDDEDTRRRTMLATCLNEKARNACFSGNITRAEVTEQVCQLTSS